MSPGPGHHQKTYGIWHISSVGHLVYLTQRKLSVGYKKVSKICAKFLGHPSMFWFWWLKGWKVSRKTFQKYTKFTIPQHWGKMFFCWQAVFSFFTWICLRSSLHLFTAVNHDETTTWNPKQPFMIYKWMFGETTIFMQWFGIIQLKHPFINGCLGFQAVGRIIQVRKKDPSFQESAASMKFVF